MGAALRFDDLIQASRTGWPRRYAFALFLVALGALARIILKQTGGDAFPYGIFLLPTFFSALTVGVGPGLLAMTLGVPLGFLITYSAEDTYWPLLHPDSRLIIYIIVSSLCVLVGSLVRRAQIRTSERGRDLRESEARLRRANEELEIRVEERTRALSEANLHLAEEMGERERAESALRQAQKMEAIGQLTGGIAHDFNNLLIVIGGNLDLLRRRVEGDERSGQLVADALRSVDRGSQLTGQLLAFARRQRLALEPTDINRVVLGMEKLLQTTLGSSIRVETTLAQPLAPAIADAGQLELVILNLAINARDAMSGAGTVRIETALAQLGAPLRPEEPPAGDYVAIAVTDTGIGIAPEHLDKVFEPFFTTKEVGKGSGLGLPQVLGVAQQGGGGVKILSQPGRGTTVQIFMPLATREATSAPAPTPTVDLKPKPVVISTGVKVLLADDDASVRSVVADMLEASGYAVTMASSGEAALDLMAKTQDFALLIVDYAMPGMSGGDVLQEAGRRWPDLPVLVITGYADASRLEAEYGVKKVIQKPFYAEEISERAAQAIDGKPR